MNDSRAAVAQRLHEQKHVEEVCGGMRQVLAEDGLEADVGVGRQCFEIHGE